MCPAIANIHQNGNDFTSYDKNLNVTWVNIKRNIGTVTKIQSLKDVKYRNNTPSSNFLTCSYLVSVQDKPSGFNTSVLYMQLPKSYQVSGVTMQDYWNKTSNTEPFYQCTKGLMKCSFLVKKMNSFK